MSVFGTPCRGSLSFLLCSSSFSCPFCPAKSICFAVIYVSKSYLQCNRNFFKACLLNVVCDLAKKKKINETNHHKRGWGIANKRTNKQTKAKQKTKTKTKTKIKQNKKQTNKQNKQIKKQNKTKQKCFYRSDSKWSGTDFVFSLTCPFLHIDVRIYLLRTLTTKTYILQ